MLTTIKFKISNQVFDLWSFWRAWNLFSHCKMFQNCKEFNGMENSKENNRQTYDMFDFKMMSIWLDTYNWLLNEYKWSFVDVMNLDFTWILCWQYLCWKWFSLSAFMNIPSVWKLIQTQRVKPFVPQCPFKKWTLWNDCCLFMAELVYFFRKYIGKPILRIDCNYYDCLQKQSSVVRIKVQPKENRAIEFLKIRTQNERERVHHYHLIVVLT